VPLVTHDYDAILDDSSIDLISIVTPPGAHKDMASRALQKRKHVLCDKPTALTADEALQMAHLARQHPSQLSLIDHELRFLSNYQRIQDLLSTGKLGQLRHIEVSVQYRPQPNQTWNWWQDKTQGGGLLGAIGSHYVDLISFITQSRVVSTIGMVETLFPTLPDAKTGEPRVCTADHYSSFQFRLASGVFGVIHLTLAPHQAPNHKVSFIGSDATAVMEQLELTVTNAAGVVEKSTEPVAPEPVQPHVWAIGTYHYGMQLHKVVSALKEQAAANVVKDSANSLIPTAATFEDGLYTQTVLDAVR
jgi:predicted dehydrogenase